MYPCSCEQLLNYKPTNLETAAIQDFLHFPAVNRQFLQRANMLSLFYLDYLQGDVQANNHEQDLPQLAGSQDAHSKPRKLKTASIDKIKGSFRPYHEIQQIIDQHMYRPVSFRRHLTNCRRLGVDLPFSEKNCKTTDMLYYIMKMFQKKRAVELTARYQQSAGIPLEDTLVWHGLLEAAGIEAAGEVWKRNIRVHGDVLRLVVENRLPQIEFCRVQDLELRFALFLQQRQAIQMGQRKKGILKNMLINQKEYRFTKECEPKMKLRLFEIRQFVQCGNQGIKMAMLKCLDQRYPVLQHAASTRDCAWLYYCDIIDV